MLNINNLSVRIIIMALALSLIPLLMVYALVSYMFTEVLISNIQQNITAQAIQAGHSVNQFFHQRITDIKMISQADILENDNYTEINQYLEEIKIENNLLHDLYVILPSGEFIAATEDKSKISTNIHDLNLSQISQLFKQTLNSKQGDVFVSEVVNLNEGLKVILMTPITDDLNINIVKVLVVELDLQAITTIINNFASSIIGKKAVYIINNYDGSVVVTTDDNSTLLEPFRDLIVNPHLLNLFSEHGASGNTIYVDADGDKVITGFVDLDEFGVNSALDYWSIIGIASIRDVAAPVYKLSKFLILLISILVLLIIFIAVLVGRSISKPILIIVQIIKDIANGNLDSKINLTNKGEIGQLSDSIRKMQQNIRDTANTAEMIANGNLDVNIRILSEHDVLGNSLTAMVNNLKKMQTEQKQQDWLKTGLNNLNDKVSGEQDLTKLAEKVINFLTPYLNAQVGALYLYTEDKGEFYLKMFASHAYVWRKQLNNKIILGEGLLGQAAYERKPIILTQVPEDYLVIRSGLGEMSASSVMVLPFLYEGELKGVVEFATAYQFTQLHLDFVQQVMPALGIAVSTAESRTKMQKLLEISQKQTSELEAQSQAMQIQQQALQRANEELQAQSEELQSQQEELRETNEQLELRTKDLENQRNEIRSKNDALRLTQTEIERKARELELSSKYKSEFLANMSHELRTPLNAIMILAQILAENEEGNLTTEQADYMQTIYSAGSDLLDLINEILDLSKVEAGKVEIKPENFSLRELIEKSIDSKFRAISTNKSVYFDIEISPQVPDNIYSGVLRVKQILNNLLSNAFKFTHEGGVKLIVDYQVTDHFKDGKPYIIIKVVDTGIGIPKDKFQVIFEAFQQVNGSINRKYGGTGLGLSISLQLAKLLGGDITVESVENQGTTFTFFLPPMMPDNSEKSPISTNPKPTESANKIILFITDNTQLAEDIKLIFKQYSDIVFINVANQEHAIAQLKQQSCDCILFDLDSMPIAELNLFDYLAQNVQLAKIPIILYGNDLSNLAQQKIQYSNLSLQFIDSFDKFAAKIKSCCGKEINKTKSDLPNSLKDKKVLLVDDDNRNIFALTSSLKHKGMVTVIASDGVEALNILQANPDVDIILMDIMMPEMDGYETMTKIRQMPKFKHLPIIALTAKAMKGDEAKCIEAGASDYLTKPINMEKLLSVMQVWLHK